MKDANFTKHLYGFPKYLEKEGLAVNSREAYGEAVIKLLYFMEDVKGVNRADLGMEDLTKDVVIECLDWIIKNEECKVNTRNYRLAGFKRFFEYSSEKNPDYTTTYQNVRDLKKIKTRNAERRAMTEEEVLLLLSQPDTTTRRGRRDYVLMTLMYYSAARVKEIATLTPANLRFNGDRPVVELFGKGGESRYVEIPPNIADMLKNYLKDFGLNEKDARDKFLFTGSRGTTNLKRQSIYRRIKKYLKAANKKDPQFDISELSCHTLRHSKATHWAEHGMHPFVISYLLGHAQLSTTMIYTKPTMKQIREAFAKAEGNEPQQETPMWGPGFDFISVFRRLSSA